LALGFDIAERSQLYAPLLVGSSDPSNILLHNIAVNSLKALLPRVDPMEVRNLVYVAFLAFENSLVVQFLETLKRRRMAGIFLERIASEFVSTAEVPSSRDNVIDCGVRVVKTHTSNCSLLSFLNKEKNCY
jgi:hypothetical protein